VAKGQESSGEVLGKDALRVYSPLKSAELSAVFMESLCLKRTLPAGRASATHTPFCRAAHGSDQRRRYFREGEDNPWSPQHVSCSAGTCQGQASDETPALADIHSAPVQRLTPCPSAAGLWGLGMIRDCIYPDIYWGRIRTLTVQQALGLYS